MILDEEVEKYLIVVVTDALTDKGEVIVKCAEDALDAAEALLLYYKAVRFSLSFAQQAQKAEVKDKEHLVKHVCAGLSLSPEIDSKLRIRAAKAFLC